MWLLQICFASFWWYLGMNMLFRESLVWATVDHLPWIRRQFGGPSTRRWERFCRDGGMVCLATGCLLFLNLPFGLGAFGIIIAAPALLFLL